MLGVRLGFLRRRDLEIINELRDPTKKIVEGYISEGIFLPFIGERDTLKSGSLRTHSET
jgi:hypothetical protein